MLRRLNLRSKLLVSSAYPLLAIVVLAAIGFTTFQTVKVNGPQYVKIASAKDLEADILPPPGYLVETHLLAALLTKSVSLDEFDRAVTSLKSLEGQFEDRHSYWQKYLSSTDAMHASMKSAFVDGRRYFSVLNEEYIPAARASLAQGQSTAPEGQKVAESIFLGKLAPIYKSHRLSIDTTVGLSLSRQDALEATTKSTVDGRLQLLGLLAGGVLLTSTVLALLSARSISRPITALTKEAIESAENGLPAAVAQIQSGEDAANIDSSASEFSGDPTEIGALARALSSMRKTAIDLAAEQALIRRNVADNLVNVARRNQLLLKRTLSSISTMEKEERDPAKLERLFQLDHLTTRMRRNAESLLVLAGSEGPKLWTSPMGMGDVVRSALSQIESYSSVDFGHLDPSLVKGAAVSDISHLLAEFLENATYFSPPTSRVTVTGRQRLDGYTLVISDDGVGMAPEAIAQANVRLSSPASFDKEPTKVLGHAVAGHLATRYGIKITVAESLSNGIAIQVHLPNSVIQDTNVVDIAAGIGTFAPGFDEQTESDLNAGLGTQPQLESLSPRPWSGAKNQSATLSQPQAPTPPQREAIRQHSGSTTGVTIDPVLASSSPAPRAQSAGQSLPQRVQSAPDQASGFSVPEILPQPTPTGNGGTLAKRVRGANLPDTGTGPVIEPDRDAAQVRNALSSLQRGVQRGTEANATITNAPSELPRRSVDGRS